MDVLIAVKRKTCDCTWKCGGHFDRGELKDSLLKDISERRLLMDLGIF